VQDGIRYHVIYRTRYHHRSLVRFRDVAGSRQTLDPFHSHLVLAGIHEGELLLVEEDTRRIAARRTVGRKRGRDDGSPMSHE
jgi:hypothetical protein